MMFRLNFILLPSFQRHFRPEEYILINPCFTPFTTCLQPICFSLSVLLKTFLVTLDEAQYWSTVQTAFCCLDSTSF